MFDKNDVKIKTTVEYVLSISDDELNDEALLNVKKNDFIRFVAKETHVDEKIVESLVKFDEFSHSFAYRTHCYIADSQNFS